MCTICELKIEFNVEHPASLSVAVATRREIESGALQGSSGKADPLGGMRLRLEAIAALKSVQERVEQVLTKEELLALPDFFTLMIESRTWGFFRPTVEGFDTNCRPDPPRVTAEDHSERDPVVLVSETAMRQFLAGKLTFEQAVQRGLIVIDADEPRSEALQSAWHLAFSKIKLSRFVCI
ncbi:MAG TPA: hypothetical protein VE860_05135 [Chthoniobacterales bacterium]|nr:hypothetical protein [Chthoniobacterales bacterium]